VRLVPVGPHWSLPFFEGMFFVGRAVRTSLYSPGTGESGARARLALRTAVRCYIRVANQNARQTRSSTGRASPKRLSRPLLSLSDCAPLDDLVVVPVGPHWSLPFFEGTNGVLQRQEPNQMKLITDSLTAQLLANGLAQRDAMDKGDEALD
jgi:hypothetical protein